MKKLLSIYRITWVLYAGILFLPIGAFWIYHETGGLVSNESVVRNISRAGGEMLELVEIKNPQVRNKLIQDIDKSFSKIEPWFLERDNSKYYVGVSTPKKDFESLVKCWSDLKSNPSKNRALECWDKAKTLSFAIEKYNTLLFDNIRNLIFLAIVFSIVLLILLVYVVRFYMYHQVCKSIIHTPDEGFHDREYCRLSLTQLCAQAERSKRPLSMMLIKLGENKHLDVEHKAQIILEIGDALKNGTRLSDIVCRISDNTFALLMPNTDNEGSSFAKNRIRDVLENGIDKRDKEFVDIDLIPLTREEGEQCHHFWKRVIKNMKR